MNIAAHIMCSGVGALQRTLRCVFEPRRLPMPALAPVEHRLLRALSSRFEHLSRRGEIASLNLDRGGELDRLGANEELPSYQSSEGASDNVRSELDQAARIAHEVKQPLSAIVINGETCLRW